MLLLSLISLVSLPVLHTFPFIFIMPSGIRKTSTLILPKPGQQYNSNEVIETEIYEITKQTTIKMLKERLELYGLPRDGIRNVLIGRLEEFASDQMAWRSLFQPQSKRKRGSQTGKRKESHSAKRVSVMFNNNNDQPVVHPYRFEGTHRPVQIQTEFQEMQLDNWTDSVLADCRDANWEGAAMLANPSHQATEDNLPAEEAELSDDRGYSTKATMRRILLHVKGIDQVLHDKIFITQTAPPSVPASAGITAPYAVASTFSTHLAPPPDSIIPPPPTSSPLANHIEFPSMIAAMPTPAQPSSDHLPTASSWSSTQVPSKHTVTLQLENGTLTFDQWEIPDPPAQHFSKQIPKLFAEWDTGTLLRVSGQYIPLKHWPDIYRARAGGKPGVWDTLKVEFANWKYLVEEKERLGSEDAFWAVYTKEDGSPLGYQKILDRLKKARADRDRADANAARKYFGNDLLRVDTNGAFQYEKGGKMKLYVKDHAIAGAWRKLLVRDPVVLARWEAIEAAEITQLLVSLNIPL
ncbi:hypothetical protein V8D89_009597, partial [Ganoderma adspersum]